MAPARQIVRGDKAARSQHGAGYGGSQSSIEAKEEMSTLAADQSADATPSVFPEPAFRSTETPAVVAVVMDFVGARLPQLDELLDNLRFKSGGPGLPGSLFQWSRGTADGVRVTEVWRSTRHFEMFLSDIIEPRLAQAGMPKPEITTYKVHSYLTQGPTVGLETPTGAASNTQPSGSQPDDAPSTRSQILRG